jgi:hypothetical protein
MRDSVGPTDPPRMMQRGDANRMSLLQKVAVVGLAIAYWPVLLMLVMALAGSGIVPSPVDFMVILVIAAALAYVTVRGVPKLRRVKK